MQQSESAKLAIGSANKGRFKGKSWDEIYGKEVADRRRVENSLSMSKKNEVLLKEKRSSLEEKLLPYLPDYENNVQISYYNVDFINKQTKHIIEVYGDYWHCNPIKYADDFMHYHFKMTAVERRKIDEDRKTHLESLGYLVTVVWESDLDEFIKNYHDNTTQPNQAPCRVCDTSKKSN
jgi:very-short-patch-repair endonuclease